MNAEQEEEEQSPPEEPQEVQRSELVGLPLVRRQMGDPLSMTGLVVAYQQRTELTTAELTAQLGIGEQGLIQLLLEERPSADCTQRDIERMAARVGANPEALWALIQAVADLITVF
jgi:hypothetical protein